MECLIKLCVAMIVLILVMISEARELRPSDHGLQYTPAANTSEAPATSFFNGGGGDVALPKAMNSSSSNSSSNDDMSWLGNNNNEARDHKTRGHVLLVVSLVCGITGVLLFVASASVYVFRHRKRKQGEAS